MQSQEISSKHPSEACNIYEWAMLKHCIDQKQFNTLQKAQKKILQQEYAQDTRLKFDIPSTCQISDEDFLSKYGVKKDEFKIIGARISDLDFFEKYNETIIWRCNGQDKSTRKYFRNQFKDAPNGREKYERCMHFLEAHGGYCNCEILFNVLPAMFEIMDELSEQKG